MSLGRAPKSLGSGSHTPKAITPDGSIKNVFSNISDTTIATALVLLIGLFYIATIRSGHGWGDDFAQYIQESKDIASGVMYTHSNYVFNPQNADVGPQTAPPGYPLLLAPVYLVWGMNFKAMKIENLFFFVGFLFLFYKLIRDELPGWYAFAALGIVGMNPAFWSLKDFVGSELAYAFFLFLCFFAIQRSGVVEDYKFSLMNCLGLALLIFFTYEVRSFGILLLPALIGCEAWRKRGIPWFSLAISALFSCLYVAQALVIRAAHGYGEMVRASTMSFGWIIHSGRDYGVELSHFWDNGYSNLPRLAVFLLTVSLALFGYWRKVRSERITVCEFYVPLHLAVTVIWPYPGGIRYLIPIFPLYVFYGLLAFLELCRRIPEKRSVALSLAMILIIAGTYIGDYSKLDFRTVPGGFGNATCIDFFNYVKGQTDPSSLFIFRKPKALGLFGERRTSVYPASGSDSDMWKYINSVHANYLVESPIDDSSWDDFVERNRSRMTQVYSNGDYTIFRVPPSSADGS